MPASIISSNTVTPKKQKIRVVVRNANEEDWLKVNPRPDKGEIIYTSDTNTLKVGDGINKYSELPDISGGSDLDLSKVVNKADELPEASADNVGDVYMYSGESNSSFIHGYIYENQEIVTYQSVIYFEPNTIVTYNFLEHSLIDFFTEYGITDCIQIAQGSFTYYRDGNIWKIEGRDSENNVIFDSLQLYTEDLEDAGFTFTIPITDIPDGQVIEYTTRFIPSYSYEWVRLDVQPDGSGGGAVESVNGKTGVVILDASDVGALPDTTVIPTTTSELVNDSGYITGITETDVREALGYTPVDPSDLSTVATTGNYSDLSGTPNLATVATTGDYDDLTNKPTIPVVPTNVSAFTNDAGYITGIDSTDVTTALGYTPVDPSDLGTAAYTNSTDYATAGQGTKADTALQPGDDISELNNDTGYITGIDSQDVENALGYIPADEASLATVATSGDYNDLLNKPTIPSTANMVTTNTAQTISAKKTTTSQIKLEGSAARIEFGTTSSENLPVFERNINTNTIEVGASTQSLNLRGSTNLTYNGSQVAMYSDVSSVQSQLSNKQNTITGAATTITNSNLATNCALVSNASGKVAASTVTSTQLGYLSGATSNIQTQLDDKQNKIPGGTAGNVLTYSGTAGTVGSTTLATVATSGSYNDLSDKPYIPAGVVVDQVYDATSQNAQSGIAVAEAVSTKQDTITDLSTIRSGAALGATAIQPADLATVATSGSYNDLSNKPTIPAAQVNSDWNSSSGVSEILNKPDLSVYALDSDVSDIQDLIPSTATDQNQLADKAFVNSSIANMAANYVTSDSQGDNFATRAALISGPYYYKGASYTPTNNDYALVESDENHNNDTTRYMYDGVQWNFQYIVNNSPFSQAQLDAINSGITAAKVTGYDSLVSNVQADWNASSGLAQILNKPTLGTAAYANTTDFATAAQGTKADNAESNIGNLSNLSTTSKSDLVSAINEVYGDAASSIQSVTEGATDGTISVDGVDVPVHGLGTAAYTSSASYDQAGAANTAETNAKNYADGLASNYATAAQGAKADTALQSGDNVSDLVNDAGYITSISSSDVTTALGYTPIESITTGSTNGTLNVDGTDVSVYGLGTAAYTSSTDYATSAQGTLASTAVQPGDLATVATTGDYTDLINTPTIPAAQVNSDWNAVSGVAQILNKPTLGTAAAASTTDFATAAQGSLADTAVQPGDLATVATSGNYSDLSGTPTIPTVNNPTITITQGGVTKGSFTLNQSSGDTIALDAGGGSSLPSQTGHSGEFLTTDGTDPSWGVATAVTFRIW